MPNLPADPHHEHCPQPRPDWVPENAGPGFATRVMQGATPVVTAKFGVGARRTKLSVEDYERGVLAGDRTTLGRAITLIESNAPAHQEQAQQLLARLLPHTGKSKRIGITGIPGAGKSTFIEAFGTYLTGQGHEIAVLAIDPSSTLTGGSILGDKVRMEQLSRQAGAFIRPSPSGGSLGGVARKTREAILVCEAAGFDVVLVETVGVGQNEVTVRSMVDFFLVLMIAGAGDEMQGIKKGVIELADALVINKADGDNLPRCTATQAEMKRVLHYLHPPTQGWHTPALLASSLTHAGVPEVWKATEDFFNNTRGSGVLVQRRQQQTVEWMHALVMESLRARFYASPGVKAHLAAVEEAVANGRQPALAAAMELLKLG
ncbi:methylmalonyl Co-A mutase-associated GTPase MeaB [Opitutus terrae]|uniref:LAO/AO transport system ATPase n=1 Tax=Opitutus terrae (strain DSM 11246 / JCM 15787 / PB90-1) TaxID=452637 RepID=B1ZTC7_OPITP|nr:methylmalonyl Co-A mutase-associated GTPase MeaB [Opitutus terrae]ACB76581.1 LAO/AO transport system ATPase [Opitutus terrae PB90-1]